jgi:hypothetical protein
MFFGRMSGRNFSRSEAGRPFLSSANRAAVPSVDPSSTMMISAATFSRPESARLCTNVGRYASMLQVGMTTEKDMAGSKVAEGPARVKQPR